MTSAIPSSSAMSSDRPANWGAVVALSLGAFALVASEFMPVSILTPIASDLAISEGLAGQAISVSGAFAVLTSLTLTTLTQNMDRKIVLMGLVALMLASGTLAALAPSFGIFLVGRAFIGVAIGGFWSMSAAVAMRLVPESSVPRALAIFNGGNALATVIAAPMGSLLGGLFGWRMAFLCLVPIAALAFLWLLSSLPSMAPTQRKQGGTLFVLFKSPVVSFGMLATALFFMGQFTLFTYLRPFLETVTSVAVSDLTAMLLMLGFAGFVGTAGIGRPLARALYPVLILWPLFLAAVGLGMLVFGHSLIGMGALMIGWGFFATSAPVGYWTWLTRTLPDDAEAGGGLMVAIIQLSITFGATLGGVLYDAWGHIPAFGASVVLLFLSGIVAGLAKKFSPNTDDV
ncbi:MFS transporter [Roseibium suaedae]|uniref:Predicted arabinose efflux permease, MFS family n=1 Tax=Roseibium suaedae TaxID=735517 RepID=A0A1M7KKU3_9HYPH|nr:MFS transporter [Roseibium suaedae]SHM66003.1 Predicted arabinose efflux permease, MFS family [Roseibium suaedae]